MRLSQRLNLTLRSTLRLAASASLALLAMVASTHAQTSISQTVTLRTGNDSGGNPLLPGANDGNITFSKTQGCATSDLHRAQAMAGNQAKAIAPVGSWIGSLSSDADARWIHSTHTPSGTYGTGLPAGSVQYAHPFNLPVTMPMNANVTIDMEIAADDTVGSVSFGPSSSTVPSSVFYSGGTFSSSSFSTFTGTPTSLGLVPGSNYLFVKQCDTAANYSGLIYSFKITIEYCVVEVDLRSGVTQGAAGPVLLPVGSDDLSVMQVPLPSGNYSTLAGGGGSAAKRISPNSAWLTNLSDTAGWINPNHFTGSVNGSGKAPTSALYRHDFQLPAIPSNATVLLDLEWAADETLYGVSLNADVTQPGGTLAIGGGLANEFSFASNAQFVGSAGVLGLGPGTNSLYLSQLENFPGANYSDNPFICSGIMYIAKLTITFPCDPTDGDTSYESFCECRLPYAPCANAGGPNEGCANSTSAGSTLTASGQAIVGGGSTLRLHANNLPNGTVSLFFQGDNFFYPMPLKDGLRCVGGEVVRIQVVFANGAFADTNVVLGPQVAGTKYYQCWYRDMNGSPCGKNANLSNAIGLIWQ
ncbi:MAG: hypothetical protein OSB14_07755 [Planctomycetota bacterium]|nr:hypothetical protein [Planctomycetota bacterium]